MIGHVIDKNRPGLIRECFDCRERMLDNLKFEKESRSDGIDNHREDLIEFFTHALLMEATGTRILLTDDREPFLAIGAILTEKYKNPRSLRLLLQLAKSGLDNAGRRTILVPPR